MIKKQTVSSNPNELVLTRLQPICQMPSTVVDFSPLLSVRDGGQTRTGSILPSFNRDGFHFTSSFLLGVDKDFYRGSLDFERVKFDERIQNAKEKNLCLPMRAIAPSNTYCQVCQTVYSDYLEHINLRTHQMAIRGSLGNQLILALKLQFETDHKKTKKIVKTSKGTRNSTRKKAVQCVTAIKAASELQKVNSSHASFAKAQNCSTQVSLLI